MLLNVTHFITHKFKISDVAQGPRPTNVQALDGLHLLRIPYTYEPMTKAQRQRLINAIFYFSRETKFAGQTKLLKLLYLLDFEHFQLTGRSVTGLEYQAWKLGPVPSEFRTEWKSGFSEDLARLIHLRPEPTSQKVRETVVPNDGASFDESYFTPRQIGLMSELAARYRNAYAQDMVTVTHVKNGPWDKTWRDSAGQNQIISYEHALPDDCNDRDEILKSSQEYRSFAQTHCAAE
jgi:uncharacterized phage-associated protein